MFYKLGVYAMKVKCLTLRGLSYVDGTTDQKAISGDRMTEVSREHSRLILFLTEGSNKFSLVILREVLKPLSPSIHPES